MYKLFVQVVTKIIRDRILEHQFDKRLEPFAPCYSQFLLLVDFKKKPILYSGLKYIQKISQNKKTQVYS
jgi:hypothetical protein